MTQAEKIELVALYDGWEKSEFKFAKGHSFTKSGYACIYEENLDYRMRYLQSLDWLHPVAMKVMDDSEPINGGNSVMIRYKICQKLRKKPINGQYLDLFEAVVEGIVFINEQKFQTK